MPRICGLLMVCLDQCALDNGDVSLCLRCDPPLSLFQEAQAVPGSPTRAHSVSGAKEQRWATVAISYEKEVESISAKKKESRPPAPPPHPKGPDLSGQEGEAAQTKKQLRAAAWWAAKRTANAKANWGGLEWLLPGPLSQRAFPSGLAVCFRARWKIQLLLLGVCPRSFGP